MPLAATECTLASLYASQSNYVPSQHAAHVITMPSVVHTSYDEHVIMAGYPFLDIKTRVSDHSHILAEIMHVC
jgi:hypothetical protein